MKIRTNHHWHEFKTRADVPLKVLREQFDWMVPPEFKDDIPAWVASDSADYWDGFFCHRGFWQHTSEYMRCESLPGWQGAHHDSMTCGTVLRVNEDGDRYQIGTFCS